MQNILQLFWEALNSEEKSYTKGSINRAIVLLAIPMIMEMLMESLFAIIDVFFVAKISVEAVATVGLTEVVATLIYSIAIGLSMAATAIVARRIGEEKPVEASKASIQALWLALVSSAIIGAIGLFFPATILRLMGASEEVVKSGTIYTQLILGTNIVILLLFLLNGIFRGAGNAAIAMKSLWLANGINIILDPVLIFGWGPFPEMGIAGAAVATIFGRGLGVFFQLYILLTGRSIIKWRREYFQIIWSTIKRLSNIAATGAGQFLIASASWVVLMRIVSPFGDEAIAGYTIAIRLIIFTLLPAWGLANAAATLVGQNLGAKQPDRAETSVWRSTRINLVFLFTVSVIYLAFAGPIIRIFNADPLVIEAGTLSLQIVSVGYTFFAISMVIGQAFNGAGDTRTPTLMNFICFWLMEIPLAYILALYFDLGLAGVCWAIVIAEIALAFSLYWNFRLGKWKKVEL